MSIHVHLGVKDVSRFLRRQYNINVEQPRELPLSLLTLVCGYSGGCPVPVLSSTVADVSGLTPLDPIVGQRAVKSAIDSLLCSP